jgi:hypothetical protein
MAGEQLSRVKKYEAGKCPVCSERIAVERVENMYRGYCAHCDVEIRTTYGAREALERRVVELERRLSYIEQRVIDDGR